jgi:cytochrome c oxidase subunit 2
MHIHRFERWWLVASLLLIVGFIATVTYGAVGVGITMVGDDSVTVDATDPVSSEEFRNPGVYETGENEYDVYVLAYQFAFMPGSDQPIRLPAGSTVTFHVASRDVIHGFAVVGTNINSMAIPGQVARLTVEFDDPATYGVVCHEYCGAGHHSMAGQIQVVPPSEFNESNATGPIDTSESIDVPDFDAESEGVSAE